MPDERWIRISREQRDALAHPVDPRSAALLYEVVAAYDQAQADEDWRDQMAQFSNETAEKLDAAINALRHIAARMEPASSISRRVDEIIHERLWPDAKPGDPEYAETYANWDRARVTPSGRIYRCPICGNVANHNAIAPICGHNHTPISMESVEIRLA